MEFLVDIQQNDNNPEGLEDLYQFSLKEKTDTEFKTALLACYEEAPDNMLYAAWYHRLRQNDFDGEKAERGANWFVAIPLALLTGLVFWWLSNENYLVIDRIPILAFFFAPIAVISMIAYLMIAGKRTGKRETMIAIGTGMVLLAFPVYTLFGPGLRLYPRTPYLNMAALHIPLVAWIGLGWSILGRDTEEKSKLAFVIKSLEVLVTGGLFAVAGGIFSAIAIGMFDALGVVIPEWVARLIFAGGGGVIPVIAVASVYDPLAAPLDQTFGQGVARLMPTLVRLLLPSTLVVLLIYIVFIFFNFRAPMENRDVLIVNNAMLFAVMGLLLGATPLQVEDLPPNLRDWMRRGIVAIAVLAAFISLYALSAILVRTFEGSLTLNRTVVIGWNLANIGILVTLIYRQWKGRKDEWVSSLQRTFSAGSVVYLIWALFVILGIPVIFR